MFLVNNTNKLTYVDPGFNIKIKSDKKIQFVIDIMFSKFETSIFNFECVINWT